MRARLALPSLVIALWAAPLSAQIERQPTPFDKEQEEAPRNVLTRAPELLEGMDPIYPEAAKAAGLEGEVVLRITLDATGRVSRVDVVKSAAKELDFAAMGAATNFRFTPAEIDGKPAAVAIEYRTVFQLEKGRELVPVEIEPPEEREVEAPPPMPVNLEGLVREAASKLPLEGVEVSVEVDRAFLSDEEKRSFGLDPEGQDPLVLVTFTDAEGRFFFRGLPPGQHRLTLAYAGYERSFTDVTVKEGERTEVIVYLRPSDAGRFETVVRERRARKEVSRISLSREEVRRVPGTFGDPLRVIENLPGLARAPFAGGALLIRGASPQDSGVYFDGVEIPLLYHFGGLTSVVNPEFLEDIEFYPGGFGAYYGRATAGIVDVTSRKLNLSSFRGYAEVDLIDSGFFFGGPVKIGELPTITFAAAARRSYIDALLPIVLDAILGEDGQGIVAVPVFWDYQLKAEMAPLAGQRFSFFAFGSDDDLKVVASGTGVDDGFDLGVKSTFHRIVGRWETQLPGGVSHFVQPFIGLNRGDLGLETELGVEASFGLFTWNWGLRDELRFSPTEAFEVAVGVDYLGSTFGVKLDVPLPSEIGSFPRVFMRLKDTNQTLSSSGTTHSGALYAEAVISPFEKLKLVPGVRADLTRVAIEEQALPDGGIAEGAEVDLWSVEPRFAARLDVLQGTTLKGAFGVYRQPPSGNQLTPQGGNPHLLKPRALQLIVGAEQRLLDDLSLDVQLYFTQRDLLVQSSSELVVLGDGVVDPVYYDNRGRGRTFGLEILLRHELTRHFWGWIAYTLSRTELDLSEIYDRYSIASFDQTHILTVVGQASLPLGFTLGARFRLVSGTPTSLPIGSVHDLDTTNYVRLSGPWGLYRLPTFHQLDVRLDRKWVFDTFSLTTYVDVINLYNAKNAEGYQEDFRHKERVPIPSLPFLPVFGVSGEF